MITDTVVSVGDAAVAADLIADLTHASQSTADAADAGDAGDGSCPPASAPAPVVYGDSAYGSSGQFLDARAAQKDPAWREDYRGTRPKVERKLGHLMHRKHGGRRARMIRQPKIDADFNLLATAHNLARLAVLRFRSTSNGWATAAA